MVSGNVALYTRETEKKKKNKKKKKKEKRKYNKLMVSGTVALFT